MPTAVVVGASGIVGRHMIARLCEAPGWKTLALSRHAGGQPGEVEHLAVDLTDAAACRAAAGRLTATTHVFWAPRTPAQDAAAEARQNLAMLRNFMEALEPAAPGLEHVNLVHGTKWYGSHLGPYRTPAREDDPGHLPPNFYFDQQAHIEGLSRERAWRWSAVRPHLVCGLSVGYPHNLVSVLAVYAAICRELGRPLRFPGTQACFDSVSQATDARLLADAMFWLATTPAAADRAYNVINADYYRWCNVWPAIADFFGMADGGVQTLPLTAFMADKEPVWRSIVARHGLRPHRLDEVADWRYADGLLRADWDDMSSTARLRRAGYDRVVETEPMLLEVLQMYRDARVIP